MASHLPDGWSSLLPQGHPLFFVPGQPFRCLPFAWVTAPGVSSRLPREVSAKCFLCGLPPCLSAWLGHLPFPSPVRVQCTHTHTGDSLVTAHLPHQSYPWEWDWIGSVHLCVPQCLTNPDAHLCWRWVSQTVWAWPYVLNHSSIDGFSRCFPFLLYK